MAGKDWKKDGDFREFVRWAALPQYARREEGLPMTQKKFAEKLGKASSTLTSWRKRDEFEELMGELTDEWMRDSIPQVVRTAKKVATTPDESGYKDRKLLMNMAEQMNSTMTIEHQGQVEHVHTAEDARTMEEGELRKAFRAELRKKPGFADATDEELNGLIEAFVDANTTGGQSLPPAKEGAEKTAEYVLSETPDSTD